MELFTYIKKRELRKSDYMLIYVVEDDANIRELEEYALVGSGYEVKTFADGGNVVEECIKNCPDLLLLDVMLPIEDGISILKRLREAPETMDLPIIMVTAKATEIDKVKGLDSGADDYVTKPFGVMELMSRIKALLRRSTKKSLDTSKLISYGPITIDENKHIVTVDGNECKLTFKEYELLKYLIKNQGIVLSRNTLIEKVWGFDYQGESRTVDMHIKTLRQKIGPAANMVKTVRNVGYKIE